MNILIDYCGHSDLFYSLFVLFEKRLGFKVYAPYGVDWITEGFLDKRTQLALDGLECEGTEEVDSTYIFSRKMEPDNGRYKVRGITLSKFKETSFDIVLTSVYFNEEPFHKVVKELQPNAKLIRQIANIHEMPTRYCKNVLCGAAYHPRDYKNLPPEQGFKSLGLNGIIYYPEQYEGYTYTEPVNHNSIICLSRHIGPKDVASWNAFKSHLIPDYDFQMYGLQHNIDYEIDPIYGPRVPHLMLPRAIKDAAFIWYTKPEGGGGYTVRQALACGRPVILRKIYSSAHTSIESQLFKHGINCIDLDEVSEERATHMVREWSQPEKHIEICEQVAKEFLQDTAFTEDADKIRVWLNTLERGVE